MIVRVVSLFYTACLYMYFFFATRYTQFCIFDLDASWKGVICISWA
jgi:hypothetical protein